MSLANSNSDKWSEAGGSVSVCQSDGTPTIRRDIMIIDGIIGPHVDIYNLFHWKKLMEERRRAAAIKIQRYWRAYAGKKQRQKLKLKIMQETGMTYEEFLEKMIAIMSRVNGRYGNGNAALQFSLIDMEKFLSQYLKFERLFKSLATDDRLIREKMMEFFEGASLFPTQKEINGAFNATFTGCEGKGELMFVLDTSREPNEQTFAAQQNFVKELVQSLSLNIGGQDRVRIGYNYITDSQSQQFGLTGFKSYKDVISAVDMMKYNPERGRLAVSLAAMNQMIQRYGRPGVHRTAVIIFTSDETSSTTAPTAVPQRKTSVANSNGYHDNGRRGSVAFKLPDVVVTSQQNGNGDKRRQSIVRLDNNLLLTAPGGNSNHQRRRSSIVGPSPSSRRGSIVATTASLGHVTDTNNNNHKAGGGGGRRRSRTDSISEQSQHRTAFEEYQVILDSLAVKQQLALASDNNVQIICVTTGNEDLRGVFRGICSRPELTFISHERFTVAKIRQEFTSHVCGKASKANTSDSTSSNAAVEGASDGSQADKTDGSSCSRKQRATGRPAGLYLDETLELVWTLYPPEGSGVDSVRKSTWMRPIVGANELNGGRLVDQASIKRNIRNLCNMNQNGINGKGGSNGQTDFNPCLRLVLETKLKRDGVLRLPVGERGVETVTDLKRALVLASAYLSK